MRNVYSKMKTNFRSIYLLIILCFCIVHASAQTTHYVKAHKELACSLSQEYGIPASIILGIAITESGAGTSKHVKFLNNHFGIIGKNNLAKHHPPIRSRYKQYPDTESCYTDFCKLISRKKFYPSLKGNTDYKKWIQKISAAGYSTMPQVWRKRIEKAIVQNHLTAFDKTDSYE